MGRYLLPELRKIAQTNPGAVLDLACGESPFRDIFAGVDHYIRVDRTKADDAVIMGDMLSVPLEDGSVDMVLLFQAITDVPDPGDVLAEVRRLLRPGGRLVVFESMAYPEHDLPHDFYRLMPQGLCTLASRAGLECDAVIYLGSIFTRFASLWNTFLIGRLVNYRLTRPLGRIGIATSNLLFGGLDALLPSGYLASDYLAIFTVAGTERGERSPIQGT